MDKIYVQAFREKEGLEGRIIRHAHGQPRPMWCWILLHQEEDGNDSGSCIFVYIKLGELDGIRWWPLALPHGLRCRVCFWYFSQLLKHENTVRMTFHDDFVCDYQMHRFLPRLSCDPL